MEFKTQTELTTWAYNYSNGDRKEMVELVTKELKAGSAPIKPEKKVKLDLEGDKGYRAYARVKVKEHFTRVLPKAQARQQPEPKAEAPAPKPKPKAPAKLPANVLSLHAIVERPSSDVHASIKRFERRNNKPAKQVDLNLCANVDYYNEHGKLPTTVDMAKVMGKGMYREQPRRQR